MCKRLLLAFLLNSLGTPFFTPSAAPGSASSQVTTMLRAKDQALLDAIAPGDTKVWDRALASDAVYVDENGVIMHREEFLKQVTPLPSGVSGSIVINSYSVMMHGDVATVIHIDDEK